MGETALFVVFSVRILTLHAYNLYLYTTVDSKLQACGALWKKLQNIFPPKVTEKAWIKMRGEIYCESKKMTSPEPLWIMLKAFGTEEVIHQKKEQLAFVKSPTFYANDPGLGNTFTFPWSCDFVEGYCLSYGITESRQKFVTTSASQQLIDDKTMMSALPFAVVLLLSAHALTSISGR